MPVAPAAGSGWKVLEVTGGWLRYNTVKERCDSHCGTHAGCKMDRTTRKGALGLSLAWLEAGVNSTRFEHIVLKDTLSNASSFSIRNAARQSFVADAAAFPQKMELLVAERDSRDGVMDEPHALACPSVWGEYSRVLEKELNAAAASV